MTEISIPVALGELVDKISILSIKVTRIADAGKLANVRAELHRLIVIAVSLGFDGGSAVERELMEINIAIWDAEDGVRACEASGDFSDRFIALARSIYRNNDRRAAVKRRISVSAGSALIEEKSY
jgi:hypothetical protein